MLYLLTKKKKRKKKEKRKMQATNCFVFLANSKCHCRHTQSPRDYGASISIAAGKCNYGNSSRYDMEKKNWHLALCFVFFYSCYQKYTNTCQMRFNNAIKVVTESSTSLVSECSFKWCVYQVWMLVGVTIKRAFCAILLLQRHFKD